jgi:hypothetical protein
VKFEIDYPAFWAWHDHSDASRRAQGCAYATYVGTWRSRFRVLQGTERITRFDEPATRAKRSFCARCGTPLFYERASAPKWVNIPRALFSGRTGREPIGRIPKQPCRLVVFLHDKRTANVFAVALSDPAAFAPGTRWPP